MTLTEQQIKIIADHPLNNTLNHFRDQFAHDAEDLVLADISTLISALLGSLAAFRLPFPDRINNVSVKLLSILHDTLDGLVDLNEFHPLVRLVLDNSLDVDIWTAVLSLIEVLCPAPSAIAPTYTQTVTTSSARLDDAELCKIIEEDLFHEIKRCTFRKVEGFWDKFFDPNRWHEDQRALLEEILKGHNGTEWTGFPSITEEEPVRKWLQSLEADFLADAPHKIHTTKDAHKFKERVGQVDIFFQKPSKGASAEHSYENVLVVGEQKKTLDTGRFKADLLQLSRYVRNVFANQPTRRFVHAFTLCASTMELWVFDRSGAYSSGPFDINKFPDKFARAFVGYATMDDEAMGLDTFIEEREDGHRYVTLDDTKGDATKIRLDKAMFSQNAIVCRGTTCFVTQNNYVAKFSWVSDKRKLEVEHLKLAEERGVKGVVRVVAHRQVTTIAEIREGLQFPEPHKFKDEINRSVNSSLVNSRLTTASTTTSSRKRKLSLSHASVTTASKRRQSVREGSKLAQELNNPASIGKDKPSLYKSAEELWNNRIYSCLVVSPAGRVISDFKTIEELLGSLRDAIQAHQSLYVTGNILHRDISSNNIIITDQQTHGFRGMLIDLDLAKVRESGPSGARHQTGTTQFMAVEVLLKINHTYRHDLESFFYVLLWMCAHKSWRNGFGGGERPQASILRNWVVGSLQNIALFKKGSMQLDGLDDIMREFPESLKKLQPLCLRIRQILFPLGKDQRIFWGTPAGDPDQLYAPIIAAFDAAIKNL